MEVKVGMNVTVDGGLGIEISGTIVALKTVRGQEIATVKTNAKRCNLIDVSVSSVTSTLGGVEQAEKAFY